MTDNRTPCYQCGDEDHVAIREARDAEIRAYAAKGVAEDDAVREEAIFTVDPADQPDTQSIPETQPDLEPEDGVHAEKDALAETEPQEDDVVTPKATKETKAKAKTDK